MSEQVKSCIICGSKDVVVWTTSNDQEYLTSTDVYTYLKCNSCITIFIDPMPVSKIADIYPANYYSFHEIKKNLAIRVKESLDRRMFRKVLNRIKKPSLKVLDVGGGSGWLLDIIKATDSRVNFTQVVDIDANAKELAEKNGHAYFHGTIEEFRTTEKFDLVLMLNLVEHIQNPKQTLTQIGNLLSDEGIILIKTPNVESWDAEIFRNSYWGGLHCPRHWVLFSQKSFRKMTEGTGLSVNYIRYTQGAPFWTWSTLISLKKRGLVSITRQRPVIYHPLNPLLNIAFASFDFIRGLFGAKTSQMFIEMEKKK